MDGKKEGFGAGKVGQRYEPLLSTLPTAYFNLGYIDATRTTTNASKHACTCNERCDP